MISKAERLVGYDLVTERDQERRTVLLCIPITASSVLRGRATLRLVEGIMPTFPERVSLASDHLTQPSKSSMLDIDYQECDALMIDSMGEVILLARHAGFSMACEGISQDPRPGPADRAL